LTETGLSSKGVVGLIGSKNIEFIIVLFGSVAQRQSRLGSDLGELLVAAPAYLPAITSPGSL